MIGWSVVSNTSGVTAYVHETRDPGIFKKTFFWIEIRLVELGWWKFQKKP